MWLSPRAIDSRHAFGDAPTTPIRTTEKTPREFVIYGPTESLIPCGPRPAGEGGYSNRCTPDEDCTFCLISRRYAVAPSDGRWQMLGVARGKPRTKAMIFPGSLLVLCFSRLCNPSSWYVSARREYRAQSGSLRGRWNRGGIREYGPRTKRVVCHPVTT